MGPDRWETIKTMAAKQFEVEDEGAEDLYVDTADGQIKQGVAEFVVFKGPMGRVKLQFQTKPRFEKKEFHYSHRAGTAARIEYKFSEHEVVHTFKVYKWEEIDEEWEEISPDQFQ